VGFAADEGSAVEEWYDNRLSASDATPVFVDGNDVDLGPVQLTPAAHVTGYLSAPANNFDGYELQAYPADDYSESAEISYNPFGQFDLVLPAGDWKLRFVDTEGLFASQWYGGSNSFRDASVIHVVGDNIALGKIPVSAGGSIIGFVRDETGAAVRNLNVTAFDPDGRSVRSADTSDSGRYAMSLLAAGPYTLRVSDDESHLFPTTWFPATQVQATTQEFDLAQGQTLSRDVVVPRSLWPPPQPGERVVTGRVVDTRGRPVQGVFVGAIWECNDYYDTFRGDFASVTDSAGRYVLHITSATTASVRLGASDYTYPPSTGGEDGYDYTSGYYADATCHDVPPVPVGTLGADITIAQKGGMVTSIASVEGSVHHDGRIYIYPATPSQPPEGWDFDPQPYQSGTVTDDDLSFTTATLRPGLYKVRFDSHGESSWWPDANSWATAGTIEVRPGETTPNIDGTLRRGLVQRTAPYVSRWAKVGQRLSAYTGSWTSGSATTYAYAWLRDGEVVGTGQSYVPVDADAGHLLSFRVTLTDGVDTIVMTSAPTGPVQTDPPPTEDPPPTPTPTPTPAPTPTPTPTTGPPSSPADPPVSAAQDLTVSPRVTGKDRGLRPGVRLLVRVPASMTPGTSVGGDLVVRERRREVASLHARRGVNRIDLGHVRPGRHTYVVSFTGTIDGVAPAPVVVKVRVPSRF